MILTVAIGVLVIGMLAFWFIVVRPIVRSHHFADAYFNREEGLWNSLSGFRTMLLSWFVIIASAMVGLYDVLIPFVAGQDWTPVTQLLPSWAWPFIWLVLGILFAWLRKITTQPPATAAPLIGPAP